MYKYEICTSIHAVYTIINVTFLYSSPPLSLFCLFKKDNVVSGVERLDLERQKMAVFSYTSITHSERK